MTGWGLSGAGPTAGPKLLMQLDPRAGGTLLRKVGTSGGPSLTFGAGDEIPRVPAHERLRSFDNSLMTQPRDQ